VYSGGKGCRSTGRVRLAKISSKHVFLSPKRKEENIFVLLENKLAKENIFGF